MLPYHVHRIATRRRLVASPAYLAARDEPRALVDLAAHNCIGYRLVSPGGIYAWDLRDGTREVAVEVSGSVRVTDALHARELALAGAGIAYLFEPLVAEDLRKGRLKGLIPKSAIRELGLFLYYAHRASEAPKLRAFVEAVRSARRSGKRADRPACAWKRR